jgi:hypothetical protein
VRVLGVLSPLDFSPGSISLGKVWISAFCNDDGKSKSFQEVGRHRVRPTRAERIM